METIIAVALTASVALTNANILTSPHPIPDTFYVNETTREVQGFTKDGRTFTQTNVVNEYTRLQKFSIDEAWWYISDKGIIGLGEGISDLTALSIYLTR